YAGALAGSELVRPADGNDKVKPTSEAVTMGRENREVTWTAKHAASKEEGPTSGSGSSPQPEPQMQPVREESGGGSDAPPPPVRRKTIPLTRILAIAADPSDASRLRLAQELRDIEYVFRGARYRTRFKLEFCQAVRPRDLLQAILDQQPSIIHFCGH